MIGCGVAAWFTGKGPKIAIVIVHWCIRHAFDELKYRGLTALTNKEEVLHYGDHRVIICSYMPTWGASGP
jgi:hypothetical protein